MTIGNRERVRDAVHRACGFRELVRCVLTAPSNLLPASVRADWPVASPPSPPGVWTPAGLRQPGLQAIRKPRDGGLLHLYPRVLNLRARNVDQRRGINPAGVNDPDRTARFSMPSPYHLQGAFMLTR